MRCSLHRTFLHNAKARRFALFCIHVPAHAASWRRPHTFPSSNQRNRTCRLDILFFFGFRLPGLPVGYRGRTPRVPPVRGVHAHSLGESRELVIRDRRVGDLPTARSVVLIIIRIIAGLADVVSLTDGSALGHNTALRPLRSSGCCMLPSGVGQVKSLARKHRKKRPGK